MDNPTPGSKSRTIKSLYFYLVSFVALMMIVWGAADMINIALKTWVFTKADTYMYRAPCPTMPYYDEKGLAVTEPATREQKVKDCEAQETMNQKNEEQNRAAQRQQSVVRDISFILVGIPLFWIHWRIVRRKDEDL